MSGFSAWLADAEDTDTMKAIAVGLPTKRVESWKYVPTRSLARTTWKQADPQGVEQFALTAGSFINVPTLDGLSVTGSDLLPGEQRRLDKMSEAHGFALTQAALEHSRLILTVGKTASVALNLHHIANQASSAGFAALVIRVEPGAQLTLIEQFDRATVEKPNLS